MNIVREHIEFERGMDPKRAMGIGISTWENVKPGDVLQAKNEVKIESSGRLNNAATYDIIPYSWYILVEHIKKHPDGKAIAIDYYWSKDLPVIPSGMLTRRIWGTYRQFKNRFDIVQPKDLREGLDFERGMDPKEAMGIGLKEEVKRGMNCLLKNSQSGGGISTINLMGNRNDLWLSIDEYSIDNEEKFKEIIFGCLSSEYFERIEKRPKLKKGSWRTSWYAIIKPKYKSSFRACFDRNGFIITESINFERGQDPKDAMEIGRVEERKQKVIDEIIKYNASEWTGSSVLAGFIRGRFSTGTGWDIPTLEEASMEELQHNLKYLQKWDEIERKQTEQRLKKFNESLDFERGQDPKKAMEIGWGDLLIRNITGDDDEGWSFDVNNKEIENILAKNMPTINDNEVNRFFHSTLKEIIDHVSVIDFRKKDYKNITSFIKREIESNSRWWMDLHSDAAMRQIARNSGMKI
jgi:hypothetical protein